jgi:hypothetical protein
MTKRTRKTIPLPARERCTIQEAVAILGKGERTIRIMASQGRIPRPAGIGGTWTFNIKALRDHVKSQEIEAASAATI